MEVNPNLQFNFNSLKKKTKEKKDMGDYGSHTLVSYRYTVYTQGQSWYTNFFWGLIWKPDPMVTFLKLLEQYLRV